MYMQYHKCPNDSVLMTAALGRVCVFSAAGRLDQVAVELPRLVEPVVGQVLQQELLNVHRGLETVLLSHLSVLVTVAKSVLVTVADGGLSGALKTQGFA